jgi:hypothetical protein
LPGIDGDGLGLYTRQSDLHIAIWIDAVADDPPMRPPLSAKPL